MTLAEFSNYKSPKNIKKYLEKLRGQPAGFEFLPTYVTHQQNLLWGDRTPHKQVFIIRGIGYRANVVANDLNLPQEFKAERYLVVRAGHSYLSCRYIPDFIGIKISKKDRKLVIYGPDKAYVMAFARLVFKIRRPSVYTGRGIRRKKMSPRRKLGKKDVRKGRFF